MNCKEDKVYFEIWDYYIIETDNLSYNILFLRKYLFIHKYIHISWADVCSNTTQHDTALLARLFMTL